MKRKVNSLMPIEIDLLTYAGLHLRGFHAWEYIKLNQLRQDSTVYRALSRLEKFGYLASTKEAAEQPWAPTRKMYRLTDIGRSISQVQPTVDPPWSGGFSAKAS